MSCRHQKLMDETDPNPQPLSPRKMIRGSLSMLKHLKEHSPSNSKRKILLRRKDRSSITESLGSLGSSISRKTGEKAKTKEELLIQLNKMATPSLNFSTSSVTSANSSSNNNNNSPPTRPKRTSSQGTKSIKSSSSSVSSSRGTSLASPTTPKSVGSYYSNNNNNNHNNHLNNNSSFSNGSPGQRSKAETAATGTTASASTASTTKTPVSVLRKNGKFHASSSSSAENNSHSNIFGGSFSDFGGGTTTSTTSSPRATAVHPVTPTTASVKRKKVRKIPLNDALQQQHHQGGINKNGSTNPNSQAYKNGSIGMGSNASSGHFIRRNGEKAMQQQSPGGSYNNNNNNKYMSSPGTQTTACADEMFADTANLPSIPHVSLSSSPVKKKKTLKLKQQQQQQQQQAVNGANTTTLVVTMPTAGDSQLNATSTTTHKSLSKKGGSNHSKKDSSNSTKKTKSQKTKSAIPLEQEEGELQQAETNNKPKKEKKKKKKVKKEQQEQQEQYQTEQENVQFGQELLQAFDDVFGEDFLVQDFHATDIHNNDHDEEGEEDVMVVAYENNQEDENAVYVHENFIADDDMLDDNYIDENVVYQDENGFVYDEYGDPVVYEEHEFVNEDGELMYDDGYIDENGNLMYNEDFADQYESYMYSEHGDPTAGYDDDDEEEEDEEDAAAEEEVLRKQQQQQQQRNALTMSHHSTNSRTAATKLYQYALQCDWHSVSKQCKKHARDAGYVGEPDGFTALHLAVISRSNPQCFSTDYVHDSCDTDTISTVVPAPLDVIEELILACPEAAITRCTRKRYTPLAYACLVADGRDYNMPDVTQMVKIILKHAPHSAMVFTDEGFSALDVHIVSYSRLHQFESETVGGGRRVNSTRVIEALLNANPSLAEARAYKNRVRGPLELLYRCNLKEFKTQSSDGPTMDKNGKVRHKSHSSTVFSMMSEWWVWKWTLILLKFASKPKDDEEHQDEPFSAVHAAARITACPIAVLSMTIDAYPAQVQERSPRDDLYNLPLHDVCSWVSDTEIISGDPFVLRRKVKAIELLLDAFPKAARMTNNMGETPLQLAIETCTPWDKGLELLVQRCPNALKFPRRLREGKDNTLSLAVQLHGDNESLFSDDTNYWSDPLEAVEGMYPFMVAAVLSHVPESRRKPPTFVFTDDVPREHEEDLATKDLESARSIYGLLRSKPEVLQKFLEEEKIRLQELQEEDEEYTEEHDDYGDEESELDETERNESFRF